MVISGAFIATYYHALPRLIFVYSSVIGIESSSCLIRGNKIGIS